MNLIVTSSVEEFNSRAAQFVLRELFKNPRLVLGIATGNTTIGIHRELARQSITLAADWSQVQSFNLDEFLGPSPADPKSCHWRTYDQLLPLPGFRRENIHLPSSDPAMAEQTLWEYPAAIREAGGIDLQLLGIGTNGHIGMNEPSTPWESDMFIVQLSSHTIADKAEFWGGSANVPQGGITMGMRLVMQGKKQLLLAKGADKAQAIRDTLFGKISPKVPASALQMHPDLTVLLDCEAASLLPLD